MACSTVSEDISGVLRGRCKDCECSGFTRTVELISHERVPLGWCILCGHSPVSHGVLTEHWTHQLERTTTVHESASVAPLFGSVCEIPTEPVQVVAVPPLEQMVEDATTSCATMCQETPDIPVPPLPASAHSSDQARLQAGRQKSSKGRCKQWDNLSLPTFSEYLDSFLCGHGMLSKTRKHMKAQLRDEVIAFLDENQLIESSNCAIRRWEYYGLGEALARSFPSVVWETTKHGQVKKLDFEFGWRSFMRSVSSTRKTRKLRSKRLVVSTTVLSTDACDGILRCNEAQEELKAIEDTVTDPASLDITRMKALLKATLEARKASPSDELPVYFLSPDVLALEAELRFKSSLEDMEAKLCEVRQTLNRGSFLDIDCYLRPKRATFSLIALEEPAVDTPFPGPFIIRMRDGEHKITFGKCCVHLTPRSSLECALILCLAAYFILNLSYPYAFGQTLGLLQTVIVKGEVFESCLMSFKLKTLLKELKNAPSKCTSTETNTN